MADLTAWAQVSTPGFALKGTSRGLPGTVRKRKRQSFRAYVDRATAGRFRWHRHNIVLADSLQRVADGDLRRLMVFMPPRYGKSEQVSRLFAPYWLHRRPHQWVGLASYGASLAQKLSRAARDHFREAGGDLAGDATAVTEWMTPDAGGLWAAGRGGSLTGRGFDLGIIDDPLKDMAEADSPVIREGLIEWYRSTFRTRAEPGAAIVVVLTRWHQLDLAGWLLEQEAVEPEHWHVVHLPEEAEDELPEYPDTCTVEPDWRAPGELLCPERFGPDEVQKHKAFPRTWASLYQQRPRPREGNLFRYSWFEDRFVDARPAQAKRVRYWDTAGTEGGGDWTVGTLMALGGDGLFYVEDVVRGQWSPGTRDQQIRATAERDGRDVTIWLEQEAGVSGTERTQGTVRALAGFTARTERPTGSKELRAEPFAAQCEVGNVRVVRGAWNRAWLEELVNFGPGAAHDDQVDATAGAFAKLAERSGASTHTLEF